MCPAAGDDVPLELPWILAGPAARSQSFRERPFLFRRDQNTTGRTVRPVHCTAWYALVKGIFPQQRSQVRQHPFREVRSPARLYPAVSFCGIPEFSPVFPHGTSQHDGDTLTGRFPRLPPVHPRRCRVRTLTGRVEALFPACEGANSTSETSEQWGGGLWRGNGERGRSVRSGRGSYFLHVTIGEGSYFVVVVFRETSRPERSRTTRVSVVVNPREPEDGEHLSPSSSIRSGSV